MSEKSKMGAVRSFVERVMGAAEARPEPARDASAVPAPRTFTIPERPIFVLPEGVYDEVAERSERWHELGREIERCDKRERKKSEELKALAEREAREGVSLEAEMGRLQEEIAATRKARERAQVRLDPALKAAWAAVLLARRKISEGRREYDKKVDAYRATLSEIAEAVQEAWSIRTGHELGETEYHRRHMEEKFDLPPVTAEFERGEPEREPPKPPSGVIEYGPEVVVTYPDEGSRKPVRSVTRQDVEEMRKASAGAEAVPAATAVEHAEADGSGGDGADLLERMRGALESEGE
jgi:hypothetical protein